MSGIKQAFWSLVICLMALACAACSLIPIPISGDDADEAGAVAAALEKRYDFPVKSKLEPTKPAVGAWPGVDVTTIVIVGVIDPAEQDKIVAIVQDIRQAVAKKPIVVRFYREEVLTTWSNPETRTRGGRSELVDLLRTVRIK